MKPARRQLAAREFSRGVALGGTVAKGQDLTGAASTRRCIANTTPEQHREKNDYQRSKSLLNADKRGEKTRVNQYTPSLSASIGVHRRLKLVLLFDLCVSAFICG
jgi:hypothetical protein